MKTEMLFLGFCGALLSVPLIAMPIGLNWPASKAVFVRPSSEAEKIISSIERTQDWQMDFSNAYNTRLNYSIWWPNEDYALGVCPNSDTCLPDSGELSDTDRVHVARAIRRHLKPMYEAQNREGVASIFSD